MAIHMTPAPEGGANVVQRNLTLQVDDTDLTMMDAGARALPRIAKPYAVFSADLENVLSDGRGLLRSAHLTSWQYVIFEGDSVVALAELADGKPLRYASQQPSAVANAVLEAIQQAETLDAVQQTDYEIRILRVPELYLMAVWLHAPENDLLIPVRPFTDTLGDGSTFTEEQVVAALRPLAQVRAATRDE